MAGDTVQWWGCWMGIHLRKGHLEVHGLALAQFGRAALQSVSALCMRAVSPVESEVCGSGLKDQNMAMGSSNDLAGVVI